MSLLLEDIDEVVEEYSYLDYLGRAEAYSEIDTYISQVDVTLSCTFYLVGVLRTTFRWRDHLSQWHRFRDAIQAEVMKRDFDVADILRGLYDDETT